MKMTPLHASLEFKRTVTIINSDRTEDRNQFLTRDQIVIDFGEAIRGASGPAVEQQARYLTFGDPRFEKELQQQTFFLCFSGPPARLNHC